MPIFLSILSFILLGAVQLFAYSSGPPNGYYGQSINCTSCHSGSAINTASMISISGLPGNYQPNTSYPLTLSLSGSNSRGFGFQLAVRSGNSNVGSLSTSQSGVRVDNGYLEHTTRINSPISFNWTSPASSSGTISFWVSSLATGGGSSTSGDQTYVYNQSLQESVSAYTLFLNAGSGGSVSGAGTFNHGTTPTIVATPNTGYNFTGWTGDGVSNSGSASTTVSMTQARSLTANFSLKSYTLSLTAGSGGSVSGAGSFNHGTTPTIVATPDTGYEFTGWSGLGVTSSNSASTTASMTEARSLTANFSLKSYTLSLTAGFGGSVSGAGNYNHGQRATIQATAHSGFVFNSWLQSGVSTDTNPSTSIIMNQDKNWTAIFTAQPSNTFLLALSSNPTSAGTTTGAGSYSQNELASVTAAPNVGYQFTGWIGSGVTSQDSNSTTVDMNQDRNLTAQFSLKSYTLNLTAEAGGAVSGEGIFNHGTNTPIGATPSTGYNFTGWIGSGVTNQDSNSTTVNMNQDRNLTATFSLAIFKLTLETSGGGVVTGGGNFPSGTSVSYNATADDGYVFKNWMLADQNHSDLNSGSITISSDLTLTAYFEKSLDPALSTAQSLGNNIFSSWLGYFLTFENGWYYHLKLGWIYPQGNSTDGLWFWSQEAGWLWTNEEIFDQSFLWSKSDNDWIFLKEGSTVGDTLLFSYKDGGSWSYLPTVLLSE